MHADFKALAESFGRFAPQVDAVSDAEWTKLVERIQVVFPAGGESKRLRGVVPKGYSKVSVPLPNGDTLIEHNIRMYRDSGLTDFILLVGHAADSIERLIGDGRRLGITVRYEHDPDKPVGTGGALRRALDNGLVDRTKYLIVHNAADIFFGYPGDLPRAFVSQHLAFEKQGSIATILAAPLSIIQGSGLKVADGFVEHIMYYTQVPVPYHTASTLFSPAIYSYFDRLFEPNRPMEFERTLFPVLADEHKLTAMKVDNEYSLQVKNEKQWEQLTDLFSKKD